jgi:hypothetical protein
MKLHCVAAPHDVLEAFRSHTSDDLFYVGVRAVGDRGVLLNLSRAEKLRAELSKFIASRKRARRSRR